MKSFDISDKDAKNLLVNDLKKRIESSNINLLIGAGFSMPLLSVLKDVETKLTQAKKKENKEEIFNIEKQFFENSIEPLLNKEKVDAGLSVRNAFLHTIIDMIALRHSSILHKSLNIFTTNYDNLIELSLEDKNIDYFDGFSGKIRANFSTNNYGKIVLKQSAVNNKTTELISVNLVKLHGSLYWNASETGIKWDNFYAKVKELASLKNDRDKFLNCYEKELAIINPNEEKYNLSVLNSNYYDQLRLFSNELEKNNSLLLAFGFSFNDEHLKIIIDRALANPTLTLCIFAFNKDDVSNLQSKFSTYNNVVVIYRTEEIEDVKEIAELDLKKASDFLEEIYNAIK